MPTTTPHRIDQTVIDFCREINARQLEYVPVFPEQDAMAVLAQLVAVID